MSLPFRSVFVLLLCTFLFCTTANAQQTFSEGSISYHVTIEPAVAESMNVPQKGMYTISIKGKMLRKELKMDNGYQTTILYNGNTEMGYSLRIIEGRKYAIQLSRQDLENEQKPFAGFKIEDMDGGKDIASVATQHAKLVYTNKTVCELYYTKAWALADNFTFERFPGITFLPMAFNYKNEQGMSFKFEAEQLKPMPIDNSVFRLPQDYKIITNREYKALSN